MKKLSVETMRYKIPKKYNRFFRVHFKILIWLLVALIIIVTLTFSYSNIFEIHKYEPKITIFFFCQVDDLDGIKEQLNYFKLSHNIYFVQYDERIIKTENGTIKYDYSFISDSFIRNCMRYFRSASESLLAVRICPPDKPVYLTANIFNNYVNIVRYSNLGIANGSICNSKMINYLVNRWH